MIRVVIERACTTQGARITTGNQAPPRVRSPVAAFSEPHTSGRPPHCRVARGQPTQIIQLLRRTLRKAEVILAFDIRVVAMLPEVGFGRVSYRSHRANRYRRRRLCDPAYRRASGRAQSYECRDSLWSAAPAPDSHPGCRSLGPAHVARGQPPHDRAASQPSPTCPTRAAVKANGQSSPALCLSPPQLKTSARCR